MEALRAESARQKRFVAAFSHELKTPMTTLLGYASMLRQGQLAPQAQQTAAGHLYREAARLEALSGQLLRFDGAGGRRLRAGGDVAAGGFSTPPPTVCRIFRRS